MEQQKLQLVNEQEASRLLACSVAALRRWRRERRGPEFTRLERCVRYDLRALERFLTEHSSQQDAADSLRQSPRLEHATLRA